MVRSNWITIVALGLTWANGALGQESRLQPVAPAGSGERTMTVQEMGKPPRKCRVLQEWHQANGSMAYKVQAVDNGEFLTIAENPSVVPTESIPVPAEGSAKPMVLKTMATRIYHWGSSMTPPAGAPVPTTTTPAAPSASCSCGGSQTCDCQDSTLLGGTRPLFPRLRAALTGRDSYSVASGGEQIIVAEQTAGAKPASAPAGTTASKPAIQPVAEKTTVNPDDWRKSWGQPAEFKTLPTAKLAEDKTTPQKTESPALPPNSMTESQSGPDPLVSPEKLAQHVEEKLAMPKPSDFHPFDHLPPPPPPPEGPAASSAVSMSSTGVPNTVTGKMPMGAQSVLAAGSAPNTVTYLPVPIVTVPVTPPPVPPAPPAPTLPAPPAGPMYANAFTPAGSQAMANRQSPYFPGGYTPSAYVPATTSVSSPYVPGQNMGQSPYYAMGQTTATPVPSPYISGQNMGQSSYDAMNQIVGSPYPSNIPPAAQPQQRPPVIYQGPTPPNPFAAMPVTPAAYTPAPTPTVMVNPAMDRRVVTMTPAQPTGQETIKQLLTTLWVSIYPSQREIAAEGLANYDWHEHPEVVPALLLAARQDAAPLVRMTCVHCLAKMKAQGDQVVTTLAALRRDIDPRVRQEVEQALVALNGAAR